MYQKYYQLALLLIINLCNAQIDLQCDGRDMHSIYISNLAGIIYRIDNVDTEPTEPIYVSTPPLLSTGNGISINANLSSITQPETMYVITPGGNYFYWLENGWVNSNHFSVSIAAANIGGTSNFIFNLDYLNGKLYRYDGSGPDILLLSNIAGNDLMADVATDNQGNFYLFYKGLQILKAYSADGTFLSEIATTGVSSMDAGLTGMTILGDHIYVVTNTKLFKGSFSGSQVDFLLIKDLGIIALDIASCHMAANPLSVLTKGNKSKVAVFPNPFEEHVNFDSGASGNYDLTIYDLLSKIVIQRQFSGPLKLNTSNFPQGMYIFEIKGENGLMQKGKIVKN